MKSLYYLISLFLFSLSIAFTGCSGSADTPVSLQIPFSGALTSDSRVVVLDGPSFGGNPVGSLSNKFQQNGNNSFNCFEDDGTLIGSVMMDQTTMSEPTVNAGLTSFTMRVCFEIDGGDVYCANSMEFGDFAFDNSDIAECAGLPEGMSCVRGAAAGIITSAPDKFQSSIGKRTIEHRYAAVISGEGSNRRFEREFHTIVLINVVE